MAFAEQNNKLKGTKGKMLEGTQILSISPASEAFFETKKYIALREKLIRPKGKSQTYFSDSRRACSAWRCCSMLKGIPSLPFPFSCWSPTPFSPISEALSSLPTQRDSEPLTGDALVGETLTSRDASTVVTGVDIVLVCLEEGGEG